MEVRSQSMLKPGEKVSGRYRVSQLLDGGGMGLIYEATDCVTGSRVALKLMKEAAAQDPSARARFSREVAALSRVESDAVAQALAADALADGTPFLAMELLDGRNLRKESRLRGPLPIPEAAAYLVQACRGVAAIHRQGIIHRDLKPHNLFITNLEGARKIKILDFGIAKWLSDESSLTTTNMAVGTPLYMSPEQLRDPRACSIAGDVWSLGVILYEIIAGFSPFSAPRHSAVIASVLSDSPVPLTQLRSDVPPALEQIVLRALAKDPGERWRSVSELEHALLAFAQPEPLIVPEHARVKRAPVAAAAATELREAFRIQRAVTERTLRRFDEQTEEPSTLVRTVSHHPRRARIRAGAILALVALSVGGLSARVIHRPSAPPALSASPATKGSVFLAAAPSAPPRIRETVIETRDSATPVSIPPLPAPPVARSSERQHATRAVALHGATAHPVRSQRPAPPPSSAQVETRTAPVAPPKPRPISLNPGSDDNPLHL
jgi:serine/threonine-protein kinase